jgi:hypothetical protein
MRGKMQNGCFAQHLSREPFFWPKNMTNSPIKWQRAQRAFKAYVSQKVAVYSETIEQHRNHDLGLR